MLSRPDKAHSVLGWFRAAMSDAVRTRTASDDALALVLSALASANRLAVLRQLREPRTVTEIRLSPESGDDSDRPIARQAVREHLRKLVEAGLVSADPVERRAKETLAYVVNHQRLFALSEEFRTLAALRPLAERADAPTSADARRLPRRVDPPRLLAVKGPDEGAAHSLAPPPGAQEASWLIGRKRGADVRVDYDPFVSLENARVEWRARAYALRCLPQATNGTTLNFEPVEPEREHALRQGDVIGVGRTLFVFQASGSG